VQRAVELAVAAAIEAVAIASPGGHRDRCDARGAREVRISGESLRTGGLADEDRGAQRAAPSLGEQLGTMPEDKVA
jgi:hypothetical protein